MLQAYVRSMVCDAHLAEDILQEIFVAAMNSREQFVEGTLFRAWVREIARRVTLSQLRKEGRNPSALDPATLDQIEKTFDAPLEQWEEERRALAACVERLAPESRRALELRYVSDLPLLAIGTQMGRSEDGIKALLKRLRQSLAECVGSQMRKSAGSGAR